jgi:hypothetical protein
MKNLILTVLFLTASFRFYAQSEYLPVSTIQVKEGAEFTSDYLGNIYVYGGGDLIKYDKSGAMLGIYSTRDFGSIGYVDASNPMKTLVVFQDFSKAIILDAALSANSSLNLAPPGMMPISIICNSRDEGYWIYDETLYRVRKVDQQLNVIAEGTDLTGVIGTEFRPDHLQESGQWLFLHDQVAGIIVLDRYGTYYKTIREDSVSNFQSDGNNLIYRVGDKLISLDVRNMTRNAYDLPSDIEIRRARLAPNRIFLLTGSELRIYSF